LGLITNRFAARLNFISAAQSITELEIKR